MKVQLPWQAWYGETGVDLAFPSGWTITVAAMRDAPAAPDAHIADALERPIGTPRLRDLAGKSKKAVIVVEDITRPLRTDAIVPHLLAELATGGLAGEDVWFAVGLGAHAPMDRQDLIRKLGRRVVDGYVVYQNVPYEHREYLGVTSRGTPVYISRFYLSADLRISVGSLTPHAYAGFGSGAKTVAVGMAGIETLHANHGRAYTVPPIFSGAVGGSDCREDLEEIAAMAGLDFAVNGVVNSRREVAGLFVGDYVLSHRAAAAFAREVCSTPLPPPADIAVFNAYPKDANLVQSVNALNAVGYALSRAIHGRGTAVLATAAPQGAGLNYLESPGMRLYLRFSREMMGLGEHGAIVFSPNLAGPEVRQLYPSDTLVFNTWGDVIAELTRRHGEAATATVFPCASLQVPAA
jgi:nickel-dependent lactate racemase